MKIMSEQLNYAEIKRHLKKPIEQKYISTKPQGGTQIKFVTVCDIKDLLDERIAPNHWEAIVKSTIVAADNLLMVVSLVIHAEDGVYCQDGTGIEKTAVKGYGDTGSNAYAQALRRAAESHGLGRELWRLELSDEQKEIVREDSKPDLKTRIRNAQQAIEELGGTVEIIKKGESGQDYFESLVEQYNRLRTAKEK